MVHDYSADGHPCSRTLSRSSTVMAADADITSPRKESLSAMHSAKSARRASYGEPCHADPQQLNNNTWGVACTLQACKESRQANAALTRGLLATQVGNDETNTQVSTNLQQSPDPEETATT
jgi:hypothetical protein